MDSQTHDQSSACPQCGCTDLFIRKDFPQKIGLGIVLLAAVTFLILAARPTTFYLGAWLLVAAVIVDAIVYLFVPKIATCYRCRADIRDRPLGPGVRAFELATAEKYRAGRQ